VYILHIEHGEAPKILRDIYDVTGKDKTLKEAVTEGR
jgi:hypothetical protein